MPECRQSGRVSIGALNGLQHSLRRRVLNEPTAIPKTFRHPATQWRLAESVVASIAAALGFNYFFLPPVGTFNIAETHPARSRITPHQWRSATSHILSTR